MRLLTDKEIAKAIDKAFGSNHWRSGWRLADVIEDSDRVIAKAQAELTRKEIVELIEAHMGIESLPYRDGATKIITLPYDVFEALKGS